jgi:hypothetical protein
MQRKMKLSIVGTLLAVMMVSVAYAWIASNTLSFYTTLVGSPFKLTILDDYTHRNPQGPPYLPGTLHYEEPVILYTNTKNWANSAYSDVQTNYKIWRTDGEAMDTSWVTVHVYDYNTAGSFDLTFTLAADSKSITAFIGPYAASAHFSADATITTTFHNSAPLVEYQADVWVSVA